MSRLCFIRLSEHELVEDYLSLHDEGVEANFAGECKDDPDLREYFYEFQDISGSFEANQ